MRPRMSARIVVMAIFVALSIGDQMVAQEPVGTAQGLPGYTAIDLGTLGGTLSWATGINEAGWVDGFSNLTGDANQHAFLWRDGLMTDIGTLGGPNSGVSFWGRRPNALGQVAGAGQTSAADSAGEDFCAFINNFFSAPSAPFVCLPFVWRGGMITPLPTLGGNGNAAQVNNLGLVAGQVDVAPDPACTPQTPRPQPVLWQNGVLHKLPQLLGFPYGGPNAINDNGQAVGILVSDCAATVAHAVLWSNGRATYLGSLGGTVNDEAVDINNRSQVVGFSSLNGNLTFHGFLWTQSDGMQDVGTLPGDAASLAIGINDAGQIVGTSFDANGNPRAFLLHNGVMTDLNTLVPASSPLFLLFAFDINSRGQIVGVAFDTVTQELHAYAASPTANAAVAGQGQKPNVQLPENVRALLRQHIPIRHFGLRPFLPQ
jgi:probable HAF family extracellular repeat protein